MKKIFYSCEGCEAEIPDKQPEKCPLCGRNKFTEIERDINKDPEDDKYNEVYEKVIKKLEEYNEGTEPEEFRYSFAD